MFTKNSFKENITYLNNIPTSSVGYIMYHILKETNISNILYILNNNLDIDNFEREILFFSPKIKIIKFYEWNTIPYDVNSPKTEIQSNRMEALYKLINFNLLYNGEKILILTTKNSIIQKVINKKDYKFFNFVPSKELPKDIEKILTNIGYIKKEIAKNIGEYSLNNNSLDIITFSNNSYRIILKEGNISEIKQLDIISQLSFGKEKEILLLPIKEIIFNTENIDNFKLNYKKYFGIPNKNDYIYNNISNNTLCDGTENWLPFFYKNKLETIFEYIPKETVFIYENFESINLIDEYYEIRLNNTNNDELIYNPIEPQMLYITEKQLKLNLGNYKNIILNSKHEETFSINIKRLPQFDNEDNISICDKLNVYLNKTKD